MCGGGRIAIPLLHDVSSSSADARTHREEERVRERRREEEGDEADEVEAAADEAGRLKGGRKRLGASQQRPRPHDAQEQPGAMHEAVEDLLRGEVAGDLRAKGGGGAAGPGAAMVEAAAPVRVRLAHWRARQSQQQIVK